jgi:N-acetylglucosaminyl-diphospho-decaprenol L-rhamnosyltransferase
METEDVTVVVATRNRRDRLMETLPHHRAPVILVDNGSDDGGPATVREGFPSVTVVTLGVNRGAAARNVGVDLASTEFVAFADDDSYWTPGSLSRAVRLLRAHPRAGMLTGRVLVGPEGRLDPVSAGMATAPIGTAPGAPGPSVLGFLACAAVFRRSAFTSVGGFAPELFIYGEEQLLAMDLAAAGWQLAYAPQLTVRHLPTPAGRQPQARRRLEARNRLLVSVLRRPAGEIRQAAADAWRADPGSLLDAAARLPWALRHRRPLPAWVEANLETLHHQRVISAAADTTSSTLMSSNAG